jgi:hypothetical protein
MVWFEKEPGEVLVHEDVGNERVLMATMDI